MIGLGKWACSVDTMFFSGDVALTVVDKNGEYDFIIDLPGIDIPDYEVKSVEEDGNTIKAVVNVPMLGKDADLSVTFDGDTFTGFLKIPFLGKVKFKDGHRVTE